MEIRTILQVHLGVFLYLGSAYTWPIEAGESTNGSEWSVTYSGEVICDTCLTGKTFHFEASPRNSASPKSFVVDSQITDIGDVIIYKSLVSVTGNLPFGGQSTTIFDLSQNAKITEFYSYNLKISEDGRYFLYKSWSPRFSDSTGVTAMLFDMEQAFSQTVDYSQYSSPEKVGTPIYPPQVLQVSGSVKYETVPDVNFETAAISQQYSVAAFSALDESGILSLVHLKLWETDATTRVCVTPLISHEIESRFLREPARNTIESIDFTSSRSVIVRLYETRGATTTFDVVLPDTCENP